MSPARAYLVFGFGSLINSFSRARTLGEVEAWPVRVRGLRREWNAPSGRIRHTALGVREDSAASCNGVLALLPVERVVALDRREGQYHRVRVDSSRVEPLGDAPPEHPIFTYVPKAPRSPTPDRPILRTYVEVTLSGCLEYGEAFAREMLDTTGGWCEHFEDDRQAPRYPAHEAHASPALLEALLRGRALV